MDFEKIIVNVYEKVKTLENKGQLPTYIPELQNVIPDSFGVYLSSIEAYQFGVGNCYERFSIQSIAKVLAVSLAYRILGEDIWKRVGVEPCKNLADITNEINIETYDKFWDLELSKKINKIHGKFDLIYSANTISHIHNLNDALSF